MSALPSVIPPKAPILPVKDAPLREAKPLLHERAPLESVTKG